MVMTSMTYWIYSKNTKFETKFTFPNLIKMLNGKTKRRIQLAFVFVELLSTEGVPQTKSLTICNMCLPFTAFDLFHSLCRGPASTFFPIKRRQCMPHTICHTHTRCTARASCTVSHLRNHLSSCRSRRWFFLCHFRCIYFFIVWI